MTSKSSYHSLLRQYWGYPNFRSNQEEIIEKIVSGHDCLAVLPTGGGKSICYQLPALMITGLTLVISPLVSLMEDQVNDLKKRKIKAAALHAGISRNKASLIIDECIGGHIKLLYLAPERLLSSKFQDSLMNLPVKLLAVDEAHCISQWGHDFRPSYLQIAAIKKIFPQVTTLALTGTATSKVQAEIIELLEMKSPVLIRNSVYRKNLFLKVFPAKQKIFDAVKIAAQSKESFIVYTRSRRNTVLIRDELKLAGISAEAYHAGIDHQARKVIQEQWINGKIKGMVATTAFGMGIDKSNVRLIIHYDVPETMEAYVQEAGRAGRDGLEGLCVLITNEQDKDVLLNKFEQQFPPIEYIQKVYKYLAHYAQIASGSAGEIILPFDFELFCKQYQLKFMRTKSAIDHLSAHQYINISNSFSQKSKVLITATKDIWSELESMPPMLKNIFQALLRLYEGILQIETPIEEQQIAKTLNTSMANVRAGLSKLEKNDFLTYSTSAERSTLRFINTRIDSKDVQLDEVKFQALKATKKEQLESVMEYLKLKECRHQFIGEYFGETLPRCGHCDNCLERKNSSGIIRQRILHLLKHDVIHLDDLVKKFDFVQRPNVLKEIMELEKEEIIEVDHAKRITLDLS